MSDKSITRETKIAEQELLMERYKTALKKGQLINDIRNGLGKEIKKNPGQAKIIKKTTTQKIMSWLRGIFTKF